MIKKKEESKWEGNNKRARKELKEENFRYMRR